MGSLLDAGWKPRQDIGNLVEWDARSFNSYADYAANVALDIEGPWEWRDADAILRAKAEFANFRVCADGAKRKNGQSATGCAIFSYLHGRRTLLYIGGSTLGLLDSAFVAELLAWRRVSTYLDFYDMKMCAFPISRI